MQYLISIHNVGAWLDEYPVCHCKVSLLFGLFVTRKGRTSGPILTIYTSYNVFQRKNVSFRVLLMSSQIWGHIPKIRKGS